MFTTCSGIDGNAIAWKHAPDQALCGAPEGIRTPNLLIRSQMLYPLSYGRFWTSVSGGLCAISVNP